jgi:hypothetical protein
MTYRHIEVEKSWKIKVVYGEDEAFRYLEIHELDDQQLDELDNDTPAMNDFPELNKAVVKELEQRATLTGIRNAADVIAQQVFRRLTYVPDATMEDVKAAIDRHLLSVETADRRVA